MKTSQVARIAVLAISASLLAASASSAQAASCVKVANVVGKNYQQAQDIWRGQGFVVLPAKDALGLGRTAWIDKHWYVTAQSPKAGTCVTKGSAVRATIKKYTD